MSTILEQYKNKIKGSFSDRMIIKGHTLQLFLFPAEILPFFPQCLPERFSSYADHITSMIVSHTEEMAASLGRPLIYLMSSKLPKEQTAP